MIQAEPPTGRKGAARGSSEHLSLEAFQGADDSWSRSDRGNLEWGHRLGSEVPEHSTDWGRIILGLSKTLSRAPHSLNQNLWVWGMGFKILTSPQSDSELGIKSVSVILEADGGSHHGGPPKSGAQGQGHAASHFQQLYDAGIVVPFYRAENGPRGLRNMLRSPAS